MRISDWSSDVCSSDLQPFAESISSKTSQIFVSERMLTHHRPGKAETLIPNPQSDIGVFFPPLRHGCPRYFRNLSRANQRAPILRDAIPGRLNMSNPVQGRKGLRRSDERLVGKEGVSTVR